MGVRNPGPGEFGDREYVAVWDLKPGPPDLTTPALFHCTDLRWKYFLVMCPPSAIKIIFRKHQLDDPCRYSHLLPVAT